MAALVVSKFPRLTVAQVTLALTGGTTTGRAAHPGTGHGTIDAARAVEEAAAITSAGPSRRPPPAQPHKPARLPTATAAAPGQAPAPGRVAGAVRGGRPSAG